MKRFFNYNYIADQEKQNIDYSILSNEISLPSGDVLNFLNKYHDLYNFWIDALFDTSLDNIKSQQVNFLRDLMNGFSVYRNISKPKKKLNHGAEDLYLMLLGNPKKTVDDILINEPRDTSNKETYKQAIELFRLREQILKKLVNKGIIKSDSDQSGIDDYEESIAERTKLRRQKSEIIKNKEQNIKNEFFKH